MIKVTNPETGKTVWRKVDRGIRLDSEGDPTGKDSQIGKLKNKPQHNPKTTPKKRRGKTPSVADKKGRAKAESLKEE